jgi:hypothetical protein
LRFYNIKTSEFGTTSFAGAEFLGDLPILIKTLSPFKKNATISKIIPTLQISRLRRAQNS